MEIQVRNRAMTTRDTALWPQRGAEDAKEKRQLKRIASHRDRREHGEQDRNNSASISQASRPSSVSSVEDPEPILRVPSVAKQNIPWHEDPMTGRCWRRWPSALLFVQYDDSSDVKRVWELSRCQHFAALGIAHVCHKEGETDNGNGSHHEGHEEHEEKP